MSDARPIRLRRIALAAFGIGLPIVVVVVSTWSGTFWPFAPILIGTWVIVMLMVRSVIKYKIYLRRFRKQREIARQEIERLEARIDEARGSPETRIK